PLYSPIGSLDSILTHGSRSAALHAERAVASPVAQYGRGHGLQEANTPDAAVAAPLAARAAGAGSNLIGFETHGKAKLQDFGIGEPRIGHMRLDHAGAVEFRARPGTSGDGTSVVQTHMTNSRLTDPEV